MDKYLKEKRFLVTKCFSKDYLFKAYYFRGKDLKNSKI